MAGQRKGPLARAKYHMKPSRIFWRFASGGQHNSFKAAAKSTLGTGRNTAVSRMTPENHQRLIAGKKPTMKKTAAAPAPTAASKRAAAKRAAGAKPAKKTAAERTRRTADGKYDGSAPALSPLGQAAYERRRTGRLEEDAQMRPLWPRKRQ